MGLYCVNVWHPLSGCVMVPPQYCTLASFTSLCGITLIWNMELPFTVQFCFFLVFWKRESVVETTILFRLKFRLRKRDMWENMREWGIEIEHCSLQQKRTKGTTGPIGPTLQLKIPKCLMDTLPLLPAPPPSLLSCPLMKEVLRHGGVLLKKVRSDP